MWGWACHPGSAWCLSSWAQGFSGCIQGFFMVPLRSACPPNHRSRVTVILPPRRQCLSSPPCELPESQGCLCVGPSILCWHLQLLLLSRSVVPNSL